MVRLIAAAAALVVAVSGCSNEVTGTPVAGLTAREVFGEFSTINFCSLLSHDALPKELGEVLAPAAPALDYCFIPVQMKGVPVEGQVGSLQPSVAPEDLGATESSRRTPPRGPKIYDGPESSDMCYRFLRFADDVWLMITAGPAAEDSAPQGDWCPLANAMVDIAIDRVTKQKVRHFIFDENSAAALDPCDLVKPEVVGVKLGWPGIEARRFPSGHECDWLDPEVEGPIARLVVTVRLVLDPDDATYETIVGRRTRIVSIPTENVGFSACMLETEHVKATAFASTELLFLEVTLPDKEKEPCRVARELAKAIWASLPTP